MSSSRVAGDKIEPNQAGIIQLGKDDENNLDIIQSEPTTKQTFQRNSELDILLSIDKTLKKILSHQEIITGDVI